MELHSYAKRRLLQKWTVEQKRRLVQARISNDYIFNSRTYNIQESWQKIVNIANLEGFSVLFVRKQWTNMLGRYKNLLSRYTVDNFVDKETADMLAGEWEFFTPIHYYMLKKVTSLHSYAQSPLHEDESEEVIPSPTENEEVEIVIAPEASVPNETAYTEPLAILDTQIRTESETINHGGGVTIKQEIIDLEDSETLSVPTTPNITSPKPSTSHHNYKEENKSLPKRKRLSYKNKYYKHCIRFNKRMERKLDSLLYVFGQVVCKEYPDIDATGLIYGYDDDQGGSSSSD